MTRLKKYLGIVLGLLLFISGCGSTSKKLELRFVFWGDLSEIEIINRIVAKFEADHPTMKVKLERAPSGAPYIEKLLTQFAGEMAPDVLFVEVNNFVNFAERGVFYDLNQFVSEDKEFNLENFYPEVVSRFTVNGKLFVIPRDTAPICCIYYNKDLFDMYGVPYPTDDWSWPKDFLSIAQKLTKYDKDNRAEHFGFVDDWTLWDPWVLSNGGNYVDNIEHPTRIMLDSPEAIQGIQFRKDLIYKYKVMPSPSQMSASGGVGSADLFVTGKAAMFLSGIWKTPYFREIKKFDWDMVMFPKGPSGLRRFSTGGSGYAINKKSKHPKEAWELVKSLAGTQGQIELAKTGLAQPADMTIVNSPYFLDDQRPKNKKLLVKAVQYVCYSPYFDQWNEFLNGFLYPALDKVWLNEKDADVVLKGIIKKSNAYFFENKKNEKP